MRKQKIEVEVIRPYPGTSYAGKPYTDLRCRWQSKHGVPSEGDLTLVDLVSNVLGQRLKVGDTLVVQVEVKSAAPAEPITGIDTTGMTEHDRVRYQRATACDRNDLESLRDALRGLQSTDDPRLLPLHDELMERYRQLLGM